MKRQPSGNTDNNGTGYQVRLTAPDGIPDGTYTLNLLINGILLDSAQASVGIGQLEINRLEEIGGLQLGGQIIDADTGDGIAGATFVLITEDFSIADFVWDSEQIYGLAIADANGRFEIDRPLEFDSPYSIYVIAEGYLPITQDGFSHQCGEPRRSWWQSARYVDSVDERLIIEVSLTENMMRDSHLLNQMIS